MGNCCGRTGQWNSRQTGLGSSLLLSLFLLRKRWYWTSINIRATRKSFIISFSVPFFFQITTRFRFPCSVVMRSLPDFTHGLFFLFCFCVFSGFPCCFSGAVESLYLIKTLFQLLRSIGVPEQNDIIAYSLQYFDWAPLVYDQRMDGNDWWLVSSFSFPFIFRRSIFLYLHREWSDWFVVVVVVVVVVFVIAFSVSTAQFPTK